MALHDDAELNFILSDLEGLIGDSIKGVSRIAKVVENLSAESRVDNFNASDEDLNQLLDQTIDLIAIQQDRNLRIVKEYDELSNVKIDAEKIHQVFLALISNACQAIEGDNKSNAEIVLRTTQLKQYVRIDVIDNGCGIPEEKLGTIFEPFYTTRNVGEGVGLGLHMAQNVIENHGGALRVSSKVGDGTILTVILPINDSISSVSGQPMDIRLSP
ncbi:ATP-binding protein [Pseudomonadales bacterium]|nr:ATP-binding protein [Pseudomonadales bacterium]